jgi:flagellin
MTRINTNISSLVAQNILQNSDNQLQTSLTRLSTGLQINSGADNPAGLIAAQTFGAEITAENQSISNAQTGDNIISTADSALAEVSSQLNTIVGLVQAAASKGGISSSEISADQQQVDSALSSIQSIGNTTLFGGQNLLNGSLAFNVNESGGSAGPFNSTNDITINSFNPGAKGGGGGGEDVAIHVASAATQASVKVDGANLQSQLSTNSTHGTATINSSALSTLSGSALAFDVAVNGGTAVTVSLSSGDAADLIGGLGTSSANSSIISSFNTALANSGVTASISSGNLVLTGALGSDVSAVGDASNLSNGNGTDNTVLSSATTTVNGTTSATQNTTTIDIQGTQGSSVISFNNDQVINSLGNLASAINAVNSTTGVTATVSNGNLLLQSAGYGSAQSVTVSGISASNSADVTLFDSKYSSNNSGGGTTLGVQTLSLGQDATGTVTDATGTNNFTASGNNISYTDGDVSLSATANPTLNGGTGTGTGTASFDVTGGALFQIGTNVNYANQVNVNIPGLDLNTLGLNSSADPTEGLNTLQSGGTNNLSASSLTNAAAIVDQAITQVSTLRGNLGALEADIFNPTITSLQTSVEQATQAQSDIQDTNFASETASLTRAQILVQAGTSVLGIANSQPQQILSLLPHS